MYETDSDQMYDPMQQRLDRIAQQIANLEQEEARLLAIGEDPYEDGEVIRFKKTMGGRVYDYAAIRYDGKWALTGTRARSPKSWYHLLTFIGDSPVEWAAVWEEEDGS